MTVSQNRSIDPLWIIILIIVWLIVASLTSCGANYHLRKAIKKNPSLFDTTTVVDTVYLEVQKVDTVTLLQKDTLTVMSIPDTVLQESIVIRYRYSTKTDSIFIEVDCPDCPQVNTTETITVEVMPTIGDIFKQYWWVLSIFILMIIFFGRNLRK